MTNIVSRRTGDPIGQQSSMAMERMRARPDISNDLGAGIRPSFAMLSIEGKEFKIRYRKQNSILKDPHTGRPAQEVEVVILGASRTVSKMYFDQPYVRGQENFPRCWSTDGIAPDNNVVDPINPVCANCPNNAIGSSTNPGSNSKACGDKKRVALVMASDIPNEMLGGPMLLSLPYMSLANLQSYGDFLKLNGDLLYYACTTWLTFDSGPYPRVQFEYGRALTDEECEQSFRHVDSAPVKRMLNEELSMDDMGNLPGTQGDVSDTNQEQTRIIPEAARPPERQVYTSSADHAPPAERPAGRSAEAPAPRQAPGSQSGGTPPPAAAPRASAPAPRSTAPAPAPAPRGATPGGFAVPSASSSVTATRSNGTTTIRTKPASEISEAISRPATPPASARTVAMPAKSPATDAQPPAATIPGSSPDHVRGPRDRRQEEGVPDELFDELMGRL